MGRDSAPRFAFRANWRDYAARLNETAIQQAGASLTVLLGADRLDGRSFLDVGCGSEARCSMTPILSVSSSSTSSIPGAYSITLARCGPRYGM